MVLKIGTLRMNSVSCSRLMSFLLPLWGSCAADQALQRAARGFQLLETALLRQPAALQHQDAREALAEVVARQRPDHAAPLAVFEDVGDDAVLRGRVEVVDRLVEHQER